jgi:bZIP Maf transcription factor
VRGTHIYIVGRDHYEEVSIVATTTEMEKVGKTAEAMARSTQQSAYTAMDYAVKAQEVNTELLRKTTEVWIEGFRKQTELSQDMAQELFEKAEDQAHAYQDFFGQWGFPFMSFPFVRMPYDPFGFWRERTQNVQKIARDTQRTAWDTQKSAAEETARVIETETTAPTNGSLPIAGYDEKSVAEISARLDTLTADQLARLKDYERRNKNRETLIREIDRRIGAAS